MERSRFERIPDGPFKKYVDYVLNLIEVEDELSSFYELFNPNKTLGKRLNAPLGSLSRLDIEYLYYYLNYNKRPTLKEELIEVMDSGLVVVYQTRVGEVSTYVDIDEDYLQTLYVSGQLDEVDDWKVTEEIDWDSFHSNEETTFYKL